LWAKINAVPVPQPIRDAAIAESDSRLRASERSAVSFSVRIDCRADQSRQHHGTLAHFRLRWYAEAPISIVLCTTIG
jgi:hypothetical protein